MSGDRSHRDCAPLDAFERAEGALERIARVVDVFTVGSLDSLRPSAQADTIASKVEAMKRRLEHLEHEAGSCSCPASGDGPGCAEKQRRDRA